MGSMWALAMPTLTELAPSAACAAVRASSSCSRSCSRVVVVSTKSATCKPQGPSHGCGRVQIKAGCV